MVTFLTEMGPGRWGEKGVKPFLPILFKAFLYLNCENVHIQIVYTFKKLNREFYKCEKPQEVRKRTQREGRK